MANSLATIMQSTAAKDKSYYHWVDLLKAIGIWGVVYIHSSLGLFSHLDLISMTNYFRFCVPIFISISFFLLEQRLISEERVGYISIEAFLKKRLPRLVVPYLFWTCVYIIINHKSTYPSISKFITNHWIGFGWSGQYYFVVLMALTVIYPWLRTVDLSQKMLGIIAIFTIFLYLPFNYTSVFCKDRNCMQLPFLYLFYMFLGIYLARKYEEIKARFQRVNLHLRLSLVLASPLFIVLEESLLGNLDSGRRVYFRASTMLASYLILVIFSSFEDSLSKAKSINYLSSYLSSWSLGIFCINPLIIGMFERFNLKILNQQMDFSLVVLLSFLVSFIVIALSILMSFIISQVGAKILVK